MEGNLRPGEGTGTANILPSGSTYECVRRPLQVRTLDELSDSGEIPARCTVVKIDTDGYDLKVLQGGVRFLARNRPVIFGEFAAHCMKWHGQSLSDVVSFGSANGYDVLTRIPDTWRFEASTGDAGFVQDLLLVPRERSGDYRFCVADRAESR